MRALALSCAATGILFAPSPAHACSPPPCWAGAFSPADGATIPANLPAIHWHPMHDNAGALTVDPSKVVLTTQSAPQTPIALTATATSEGDYLLVPTTPLSPGETYVLVDHTVCPSASIAAPHATFHTGAVAPLPSQLGTLTTSPTLGSLMVGTSSGSCSTDVTAASAEIAVHAAQDAQAWNDALFYQTLVDGVPWAGAHSIRDATPPGTSWEGRGLDRVYHLCATSDSGTFDGVTAGMHQVTVQATLPGASVMLSAAPVAIDLDCNNGSGSGSVGGGNSPSTSGCTATGSPGALPLLAALALRRRRRKK